MNLKKGFNRLFICLGIVASGFGFIFGGYEADDQWRNNERYAFFTTNWNDENIQKYHDTAKKKNRNDPLGLYDKWVINGTTEDLPEYKTNPPKFNSFVFREAFPEALTTPSYFIWIGRILGAMLGFCICYGAFYLVYSAIKWIAIGFKGE